MKSSAQDTTYKARPLKNMTTQVPSVPKDMEYNQVMTNTGEKAQVLARALTKGMSADYPVK